MPVLVTREDRFAQKAKAFEQFLLSHHFYPSHFHKDNRESRDLGNWVARQRWLYRRNKLARGRVLVLERVDVNFFSHVARGRRVTPLRWDPFVTRRGCLSQQAAINSFIDHQGRPYVTTYDSIAAYVVGCLDISDVCPSSCHPDSTPGSIERVLSFVLHESGRTFEI